MHDLYCPHCGYNLCGIDSAVCPECGQHFDRATLDVSQIPWVHRKEIGNWRTYRRTVWLATFHISKIAYEMTRPVSLRDAQRFRLIVSIIAAAPIVVAIVIAHFLNPVFDPDMINDALMSGRLTRLDLAIPLAAGMLLLPVLPPIILLIAIVVSRHAPKHWAFYISEESMTEFAESTLRGEHAQGASECRGVYRVTVDAVDSNHVWLFTDYGYDAVAYGFLYVPSGPPSDLEQTGRIHLQGPWYIHWDLYPRP